MRTENKFSSTAPALETPGPHIAPRNCPIFFPEAVDVQGPGLNATSIEPQVETRNDQARGFGGLRLNEGLISWTLPC